MTDETIKPVLPLSLPPLQTFIDADQLQTDLAFSENNLSEAFSRHAALYAHYASQSHRAEHQADRAESAMRLCAAKLAKRVRDAATEAGEKRPTKDEVDTTVSLHPVHMAVEKRFHEAKLIAGLVREAANAFKQRRDMLIQLGSDTREERKGELRMQEITATETRRSDLRQMALARVGASTEKHEPFVEDRHHAVRGA